MAITKTDKGWLADFYQRGRGSKRYQRTFRTKLEAEQFERWVRQQATDNQAWTVPKNDNRRLSELIKKWYELHGQHLKDSKARLQHLQATCKRLNNPIATEFDGNNFTTYRTKRLNAGISANTINHEHSYLRAVYNELIRFNEWKSENPLAKVRQLKIDERELSYLTDKQITILINELSNSKNKDVKHIALVCLATGARWSEAETLTATQLHNNRIQFTQTKSGKNRTVPIAKKLFKSLKKRKKTGRLFTNSLEAFKLAVKRSNIQLPKGQLTHILRHTFASHFMMNGGDILTLQKIMGHSTLTMTLRYAHLAPDHLKQAVSLNPVVDLWMLDDNQQPETLA